jgi:hypothetical protein
LKSYRKFQREPHRRKIGKIGASSGYQSSDAWNFTIESNIVVGAIITVRSMLQTNRNPFMNSQLTIQPLGPCHNRQNIVNEGFIPVASDPLSSYLFIPSHHVPRTLFPIENLNSRTNSSLYSDHHALALYLITVS